MYEFEQIDRLSDVKITDNNSEFIKSLMCAAVLTYTSDNIIEIMKETLRTIIL